MNRKRILIIGHSSNEPRQKWLFESKEFEEFDILMVVPKIWTNKENKEYQNKNLKIKVLPTLFNGQIGRYILIGLGRIINNFNPDLIYYQGEPWSLESVQCAFYAKRKKIPLVLYTFENLEKVYERRDRKYLGLLKLFEYYTLKITKTIIAGNESAKNILLKRGFKNNIVILPISGINDKLFFKKNNFKRENKFKNKKVVLYLGRIVEEKGIDEILESVKSVSEKVRNVLFVFVGSGNLLGHSKKFVNANNLNNFVNFIEEVPYTEVPDLMNSSDLFIYPSRKTPYWEEQFGFSIAEALSCGLPVISTKTGAIEEWFGKYITLIEERDSKNLSINIIKLLNKRTNKYKNEFSLKNVAEKLKNILKNEIKK